MELLSVVELVVVLVVESVVVLVVESVVVLVHSSARARRRHWSARQVVRSSIGRSSRADRTFPSRGLPGGRSCSIPTLSVPGIGRRETPMVVVVDNILFDRIYDHVVASEEELPIVRKLFRESVGDLYHR